MHRLVNNYTAAIILGACVLGCSHIISYHDRYIDQTFSAIQSISQTAAIAGSGSQLVAHFTFDDGTATDISGNGNGASIIGAGPIAGTVGTGALLFDGTDDLITLSNPSNYNSSEYTISFWIKPSPNFSGTIFRLSNSTSNTTSRSKYEFRANGSGITFITGNGSVADIDTFSSSIPGETWTHVVCTQSGTTKSCYKNGSLISEATSDVDISLISPSTALVGTNRNLAGNNFYEGGLDDLRFYSRALTNEEIGELYNVATPSSGSTNPEPLPNPVNGSCGITNNSCTVGSLTDINDSSTEYLWRCAGSDGGSTALCSLAIPPQTTTGNMCSSVTQHGITWTFDKEYQCGTFANGDYWVVGPTVITSITPNFTGTANGWEVNPASNGISSTMKQGFDSMTAGFDASLVPSLPYTAQPNQSIVKSVHAACAPNCTNNTSVLQTAAVLTVLADIPPDNGATVFRPPYVGSSKPLFRTTSLRTELLPSLAPVGTPPSLSGIKRNFERVQLDHFYAVSSSWRNLHPIDNMPDYGGDIGRRNSEALRLFLNDSLSTKMPALIAYTQYGIDLLHMAALGQNWRIGGSGHKPGQLLPLAFAAVMLNDNNLKSIMQSVVTGGIEENAVAYQNAAGVSLFGQVEGTGPTAERNYWQSVATQDGFKTRRDPYEYVDGGYLPGTSYQSIITPVFRSEVLAFDLIPELKTVWYKKEFFDYVHRSMNIGAWSQPDPCAPYDGSMTNYGITFGPNGQGSCIKDTNPADGIGRFPNRHGVAFYSSAYRTAFQDAMWNAYKIAQSQPPVSTPNPTNTQTNTPTNTNSQTTPTNTQTNTQTSSGGASGITITGVNLTTAPDLTLNMSRGSTVKEVLVLQALLQDEGLLTGSFSNGIYDRATEEAVRSFQRKNNISSFGTVNAATRLKLNELLKKRRASQQQTVGTPTVTVVKLLTAPRTLGTTHLEIQKLQQFLNNNGYTIATVGSGSKGSETTYFGPATLKALNRFQIAKSLTSRTLDITTVNLINTLANATSTPVTTLPTTNSVFSRTLSLGMSGEDVKALQIFLNNKGFTIAVSGPGSKGNETTFFGAGTKAALIRFQEAYRAEILTPNGLTKGTGSMGPSTIRKVNELK